MNQLSAYSVIAGQKSTPIDLSSYQPMSLQKFKELQKDIKSLAEGWAAEAGECEFEYVSLSHEYTAEEQLKNAIDTISKMEKLTVSVSVGNRRSEGYYASIALCGYSGLKSQTIHVELISSKFFDRRASWEFAGFLNEMVG